MVEMTLSIIASINSSFDESHCKLTYFPRNNSLETVLAFGFSSWKSQSNMFVYPSVSSIKHVSHAVLFS